MAVNSTPNALDFTQYAKLRAGAEQNDPQTIRKVAQQFESLFTKMMLKSMRATQFGDDMTGPQGDIYKDMYDQQLASQLSTGKGLGLADMLIRQFGGAASAAGGAAGLASGGIAGVASAAASAARAAYSSVASQDSGTDSTDTDWQPKTAQEFVDAVKPHAEKAAAELGVSAKALIAQAALETGWGKHLPRHADGSVSFNLFGIKAVGSVPQLSQTTTEYVDGQPQQRVESFRAFGSISDAFNGYVKLLKNNPRYADALRAGSDIKHFARSLQKAGYATDPAYADKLIRVANSSLMDGGSATTTA